MKFIALGGAGDIGANCYYLEADDTRLLLDCGKAVKNGVATGPNFTRLIPEHIISHSQIDAVIISHGHFDHIGYLPEFNALSAGAPAYATDLTKKLGEFLMLDKLIKFEKTSDEKRLRSIISKTDALSAIIPKSLSRPFKIKNLTVTFYGAGHMPGAAMTYIESQNEGSVLYTGDFMARPTSLAREYLLPDTLKPDTLVMCGTYARQPSHYLNYDMSPVAKRAIEAFYRKRPLLITTRQMTKGIEAAMYLSDKFKAEGADFPIFVSEGIYALAQRLGECGITVMSELWRRFPSVIERGRQKPGIYIGGAGYTYLFKEQNVISADFPLHASYGDCEALISRLKPKNAIIVHSPPDSNPRGNGDTLLREKFPETNVIYPAEGREYPL